MITQKHYSEKIRAYCKIGKVKLEIKADLEKKVCFRNDVVGKSR